MVNRYGLKKILLSSLIQISSQRIIWCFGQWQPLYDKIRKKIPKIEFVNGIPDHLNDQHYINAGKRNILVFDDLMTDAKCDQRIANLFTKWKPPQKHIRSVSHSECIPSRKVVPRHHFKYAVYVLFNNPIDRQQVATLARRIYPSTSAAFMKRFEQATSYPYSHLVIDFKSDTAEKTGYIQRYLIQQK